MRLLTHSLSVAILLAIAAIGVGWLSPERFGIVGLFGWVALFWATVSLGIAQLIQVRRSPHRTDR